jgi:chorismate mutase / prephenate dehydratase
MSQPIQSEGLGALRVQIDAIDQQLLSLLNQRANVAEKVGEIKRAEGSPFFRPDRVAQVIEKIQNANQGPLLNQHVAAIWREIMSACLALEAPQRVAVLGPEGTFTEQAAIEFFGSAANLIYCSSFDEVFHATAAGTAQYGVVGVENSTEGVVARSLDLFLRSPVHVVGEVSLLVRHNLLRQVNDLNQVEVVMAHPQALAQCQGWLTQHMPHAERRAVSSNAEGARLAATNPAWAAIASERAAAQFGLHIVSHAIQDEAWNRTRFLVTARLRPRLHQPGGVGAQPAGRRARPAGAAQEQRRVHDPLRIAPGQVRPVGVLLLHRPRGPPVPTQRCRRPEGTAGPVRLLQSARRLPGERMT